MEKGMDKEKKYIKKINKQILLMMGNGRMI